MKKGIILNLKRFKLIDYVTQSKLLIVIFLFFLIGIVLGSTALLKNEILSKNTKLFFEDFIILHTQNKFFYKFISCLTKYFLILVLYFLSGTFILGIVITPFILIWQGIIIGNIVSHIYANYGLNGIAFNAIVFLPPLIIFVLCCFFAAQNSILFSFNIAKLTLPKSRPINLYDMFKKHCVKYLIFIGISLVCVFIEISLNSLFINFFNF